jgi:hypothetical protein
MTTAATKTFNKRFNAQRAAKAAIGKDAQEGREFVTNKTDNGEWAWVATATPEVTQQPTTREIMDAIREPAGPIPTPPDFSAKTHERYRGKLAAVVAMVEARDVPGLRAFHINPSSTSPKAIMRYRDKAIAALTA